MHDCVVDQKLLSLCMCACLRGKPACMWLMCSKNYRFNVHDVQLALHKKNRNKGTKPVEI